MAFTHGRPGLARGTLLVDSHEIGPGRYHCAREDFGWASTRFDTREGRIYCDDFVISPYFGDASFSILLRWIYFQLSPCMQIVPHGIFMYYLAFDKS